LRTPRRLGYNIPNNDLTPSATAGAVPPSVATRESRQTMPIASTCPTCRTGYNLDDSLRGKRVICQTCKDAFLVQETLVVPALAGASGAAPPPLPPGYGLAPPQVPDPRQGVPMPPQPAPAAYPQPPLESDWDRVPRRRRSRGYGPGSGGLSTGAIVAIVLTPLAVLVVVGLLIAWVSSASRSVNDPWVDDQRPRPGAVPIVVPPARFNNPPPPRFNPPPPRFNPPRVRFR
jgi:hypothetical protein